METSKGTPIVPLMLIEALKGDDEARAFFESLTDGYKRRYCDWVGNAKQQVKRESRAQWALVMLKNKQKTLKIGSYMGDVGIIKKIDDVPELKGELISVCESKSHKDVSRYSLLLAEHILRLTNIPLDDVIEECFDINRKWQEGTANFQEARDVAGKMFQLAREEKDPVKIKVLRVMGQVAATPHVKRHALIASDYAITLINLMYPQNMDEVRKERNIQIELMRSI